ncbi:MAG: sugar phosphate isomerase/epimerase [Ruminococcaceae bacterium]|nr:sugar phosphate isomerase/epimerase [Oscillospiraceae bacterium]
MERKIGAQLYTIRDHVKTDAELEASIDKLVKIGYTFGQKSAMDHIAPEKLKEITQKTGFEFTGDHISFDSYDNIEKVILEHKIYNCMMPGVGSLPTEMRTSKEGILSFMKKANEVSDKLATEGMTFTYHNHAFEFTKIDGKNIMDYILETANENFKLMVDVYWLSYAGINPVKFLRKYKDMVGGVHYKDLKIVDNAPQMCEVGEGNLDWEEICAVCDEIKPRYIYVEQDRYWTDDDPIKALEISYNNLKKLGYK